MQAPSSRLIDLVVREAFHNSAKRSDAPTCHEDTRVAIIDDVLAWLNDATDPHPIRWMNGSAGVGKSAIAQTIAQRMYDEGRLAGSFFYSGTSEDLGRRDDSRLIPTLAYQLSQNIPESGHHISVAAAKNELLFDLNLKTQLEKLIIDPISACSDEMATPILSRIVIIDGSDESSSRDKQMQVIRHLVAAFAKMFKTCSNLPIKLLMSSRREHHILSTFSDPSITNYIDTVTLDFHPDAKDDILKYLTLSLFKIRRVHRLRALLSPDWPTYEDIEELVHRSSGQFIYAATVKKYIESEQHNPMVRMHTIMTLDQSRDSKPYAALDALYSHILQRLSDEDLLLARQIFHVTHFVRQQHNKLLTQIFDCRHLSMLQSLFNVSEDVMLLALGNLSSLLTIEFGSIRFFHASFVDFLLEPVRAGPFYLMEQTITLSIFRACFSCIPRLNTIVHANTRANCAIVCCEYPRSVSILDPQLLLEIPTLFAKINMETLFQTYTNLPGYPPHRRAYRFFAGFLNWLLEEDQYFPTGVEQVQTWILKQLSKFPDRNALSVHSNSLDHNAEWLQRIVIDQEFALAWRLIASSVYQKTKDECELPFTAFVQNAQLFGKYALSVAKCRYCALQCYTHLLNDLPYVQVIAQFKDIINRSTPTRETATFDPTPYVDEIIGYAEDFLFFVGPDLDLYFSLVKILIDAHGGTTLIPEGLPSCILQACLGMDRNSFFTPQDVTQLTRYMESCFRRKRLPSTKWSARLALRIIDYLTKTRREFRFLRATLNSLD